jgi:hypothetical protein
LRVAITLGDLRKNCFHLRIFLNISAQLGRANALKVQE